MTFSTVFWDDKYCVIVWKFLKSAEQSKLLCNIVSKSHFTLCKVRQQQFIGEVDKFLFSTVKCLKDVVYQKLLESRDFSVIQTIKLMAGGVFF